MARFPRSIAVALVCCALGSNATRSQGQDYFQWKDGEGTVHFSDSLESVPPKYRDQVGRRKFETPPKKSQPPEEDLSPEAGSGTDQPAAAPAGKKRYEIPYVARDAEGSLRIIIPVTFNESVTASMAVDTGAPGMIISPGLAERIGVFDAGSAKLAIMAGGIGGDVPAIRTIVDSVRVGEAGGLFVPTTVTPSLSDSFEGLVGMDFLGHYGVTIDTRKRVVVFEERPETDDWPGGHDEAWWRATYREFSSYRTGWKNFLARNEAVGEIKEFAESQLAEAQRLFDKLNQFARENSVPIEWRD